MNFNEVYVERLAYFILSLFVLIIIALIFTAIPGPVIRYYGIGGLEQLSIFYSKLITAVILCIIFAMLAYAIRPLIFVDVFLDASLVLLVLANYLSILSMGYVVCGWLPFILYLKHSEIPASSIAILDLSQLALVSLIIKKREFLLRILREHVCQQS